MRRLWAIRGEQPLREARQCRGKVNFTIINRENGKNQLFSRFLQYFFSQACDLRKRPKIVLVDARNRA